MTVEPPGVTEHPHGCWVRCVCGGCNGTGDTNTGGCVSANCDDSAAVAAACPAICQNWGLTCTSATPDATIPAYKDACEVCSATQNCSVGACFFAATSCDRRCDSDSDCGGNCLTCLDQDQGNVCVPPLAGNQCPFTPRMFTEGDLLASNPDRTGEFSSTYLDFFNGQTTFNVLGSSTISINHPDASGSTTVETGTLTVIARNCPGPSCAMTLKDAALKAHDFEVEVTGPNPTVSNMRITNMKPAPFAIIDDGSNFAVPSLGVTMLVGYHLDDGSDHIVNSQNGSDASGTLDFSTGTLTLNGSFRSGDATIGVNLTAVVSNRPPRADAGPDQRIECSGPSGALVTLDGTHSSDAAPGPGIAAYHWYENFNHTTGTGDLRADGATPTITLAKGPHTLTLVAVDGAGALGVDDVFVEVVDTTAPVLTIAIPNDCMWPPIHQFLKYELGSDVTVSAQDTCSGDLTAGVHIATVVGNQIEDRPKCPDPDDGRPDITSDATAFCVRAERCPGKNEDRIYTVTVAATDGSGNTGTISYPIVVPSNPLFPLSHDRNIVHPVTPVDLTGHERHCGFDQPRSFVFNGDPRCELGGAHTGPPTAQGDANGDVALALADQTPETRQTSMALMETATTSRSGACDLGGGGASLGGTLAFALGAAFVARARRRPSARR